MEQRRLLVWDSSQSCDTLVDLRPKMRRRELLESSQCTLQETRVLRPAEPTNLTRAGEMLA
jgi:hypothetical protein